MKLEGHFYFLGDHHYYYYVLCSMLVHLHPLGLSPLRCYACPPPLTCYPPLRRLKLVACPPSLSLDSVTLSLWYENRRVLRRVEKQKRVHTKNNHLFLPHSQQLSTTLNNSQQLSTTLNSSQQQRCHPFPFPKKTWLHCPVALSSW